MGRTLYLSGSQLIVLDNACVPITKAFGSPPYLVGSVTERRDWRDVDVRTILSDDAFDDLFRGRESLWALLCLSVSEYLSRLSRLPVDYQVQRRTEANAKYGGKERNPLGMGTREYCGGGDAKPAMGDEAFNGE